VTDPAHQDERALRAELRDLYDDYAAAIDALRLDDWAAYFTEDALYKVIGRETYDQGLSHATIYCDSGAMIRDRAAAIRETAVFEPRFQRHFISGVRLEGQASGEIRARANFLVVESMFNAETRVLLAGEYVDRLVRQDGRLRFAERLAVYDSYRIPTTLILPV
jgi:anthranilate 1,2-dioxygenase small subunit